MRNFVLLLLLIVLVVLWEWMGSSTATHPPVASARSSTSTGQYYRNLARQDALRAGIPPDSFVRQINEESGFNPAAISPAGAIGIAQFMPATAAGLGIDPRDPVASLAGAARLMASYQQRYGGSYAMALAAYNAGSGRLTQAINACGISWQTCLPSETQAYIHTILNEAIQPTTRGLVENIQGEEARI